MIQVEARGLSAVSCKLVHTRDTRELPNVTLLAETLYNACVRSGVALDIALIQKVLYLSFLPSKLLCFLHPSFERKEIPISKISSDISQQSFQKEKWPTTPLLTIDQFFGHHSSSNHQEYNYWNQCESQFD